MAKDIWFHRYENGVDIEGRCKIVYRHFYCQNIADSFLVDYNSWQESEQGLALAASLEKDVILAEGKMMDDQNAAF